MVDGGSSSLHRPSNLTPAPVAVGPLKAAGNICVNAHRGEMEDLELVFTLNSSMNLVTQESSFKMQPVPAGSLQWPTQRAEVQLEKAHSPKRSHHILRNPTRSNNMRAKIWVGVIDISGLPFHQ